MARTDTEGFYKFAQFYGHKKGKYVYANQYSYDERSFDNSVRCFKNITNN